MKVAITGANGFLGSYLVKECLQQKMEVHALIRKGANTSLVDLSEAHFRIHKLDYSALLDSQFSKLSSSIGPLDFFVHNAGMTVSLDNEEYYDVNVGLTKKIINALETSHLLKKDGVFTYTSSYAAHGPIQIKEPVSHYGRSKLQAEEIIKKRLKSHLIARPTAIYGSGDIAFLPLFKSSFKGIYPVVDYNQRMSMIHAADLAHGIISDMQSKTGIIHYSDGNTYLHNDFIEALEYIFEKKVRKISLPKSLVKASMWISDLWHTIIKKRPGITLEKFTEISQNWDLHSSDLPHSTVECKIELSDGFKDALTFYKKNNLI